MGNRGQPGAAGPEGFPGVGGNVGNRGPDGQPGNAGQPGAAGSKGIGGDTGNVGLPGNPGPQGSRGIFYYFDKFNHGLIYNDFFIFYICILYFRIF